MQEKEEEFGPVTYFPNFFDNLFGIEEKDEEEEEFSPATYFPGFFDKFDDIDQFLDPYHQASKNYKQNFNNYVNGECSAEQVRNAMIQYALAEQQLIKEGLELKKLADNAYQDLSNAGPEEVVSLSTENTLAKLAEAEESDYTPSENDFIQALSIAEGNVEDVLHDENEIVVDTAVQESIDYSWRDAFSDIELSEPEGFNVSDSSLEEKRREVKSREPRYIQ